MQHDIMIKVIIIHDINHPSCPFAAAIQPAFADIPGFTRGEIKIPP
jgi:hypothetical protein